MYIFATSQTDIFTLCGTPTPLGPTNTGILFCEIFIKKKGEGFPGGAVVENPPANAVDTGSSPGLGGSHMPRSN